MEEMTIPQTEGDLACQETGNGLFDHSTFIADTAGKRPLLYHALKRLLDIVLVIFGLVVLIPVFLIIAICIKLDDGGNIFYSREMVGLRGRSFFLLKFRTMIPDAGAYLEERPELQQEFLQNMKLKHDPRVTRVGRFLRKTYLDELPQLFNILVGQMSLVGPRAIHQSELALYSKYAQKRHSVKPGLTGLWQISPTRYSYYEERIPLDMQYIDTRSFIVDLTILIKTLKVFASCSGF